MKKENEQYTSRDLTCIAYLLACGFKLESYKIGANGLALFTFQQSTELENEVQKFYQMTATINPVLYSNSLRNLKTMLHTNRQDEGRIMNYENEKHMHPSFSQR